MQILGKILKFAIGENKRMLVDIVKVLRLPIDIRKGYLQGARLSKIKKTNSIFNGIKNRSIGILRKGIAPHLGGLFGAATYPVPLPLFSTGMYYVGKQTGKGLTRILK